MTLCPELLTDLGGGHLICLGNPPLCCDPSQAWLLCEHLQSIPIPAPETRGPSSPRVPRGSPRPVRQPALTLARGSRGSLS